MTDTTKKTDELSDDQLQDEFEKMLLDFINQEPDGSQVDAAYQYDDDEEPDTDDAEADWYARMAATNSPQERHRLMRLYAKKTVASALSDSSP